MADESKNTTTTVPEQQQTAAAPTENTQAAEGTTAPAEKVVPKELFDKKISEMNKENKRLKAELAAKMTDDEKAAAEQNETLQELKEARNEIARYKIESALTAVGISSEISQKLAKAIVENESESIIMAIKDALIANSKDTEGRVRREILEKGSPSGVNVSGGSTAEKPDENMELVKSVVKPDQRVPLEQSKWF